MPLVDEPCEAHEHAARVGTPVGSEQARECRHKVGAAVVLDRVRERLSDLGGGGDEPEVVPQPLDERAGDGDRALQSVDGRRVAEFVAERCEKPVLVSTGSFPVFRIMKLPVP